jgi:hypothetical protein
LSWRRAKKTLSTGTEVRHDLAYECALFLAGRYGEHLQAAGRATPAWVRLNPLAHGSCQDLVGFSREVGAQPRELEWAPAIRYLAGEILAMVGTDTERLRTLQRDVLIPLELRLASDWFATMSPAKLVTMVSHALERC